MKDFMSKDFMSIGEILIDSVPYKVENFSRPLYQMNPGGAPANVACVMAKLGHDSGFIGRVGNDVFGGECISALNECGVDTSNMIISEDDPTTLALVCLDESGNRSFSFYRNGSADVGLTCEHLDELDFPNAKLFHFGSVSLSCEPSRGATLYGVEIAKKKGSVISYDPNFRPALWKNHNEAFCEIMKCFPLADIIKLSEEEGEFLFNEKDPVKVCKILETEFSPQMVVVTQATQGCTCSVNGKIYTAPAYDVNTIDTTGAGDCFWGGLMHCLLKSGKSLNSLRELTNEEILYMLEFSNAIGSLATSKKGAIPAIPTIEEIENCIKSTPKIKRL